MYNNIATGKALQEIAQYLHQHEEHFSPIPDDALTEALGIVMKNNFFIFRDTFWLQLIGTAMVTPPAPTPANLTLAIHKNLIIKNTPISSSAINATSTILLVSGMALIQKKTTIHG